MEFPLRREDLTFVDRAPVVRRLRATLARAPAKVFAAVSDPWSWPSWFPGVHTAEYTGAPPFGVGTRREARVGRTRWVEEVIAWDAPRQWAYTVIASSLPVAAAQVEVFDLVPAAGGTRITWTLAYAPRLLMRLAGPVAPWAMGHVFTRAMTNLQAYLAPEGESR